MMKALIEGVRHTALRDRILGRVCAEDIISPETQETIIEAGTLLTESLLDLVESQGIDEVRVRAPLTCATRYGLCAGSAMAVT